MILITGASGFIGSLLVRQFAGDGKPVRCTSRSEVDFGALQFEWVKSEDLGSDNDWSEHLRGVDTVIHSAAIAHAGGGIPYSRYEKANVSGAANLALQAARKGVKRFVFLSSIKVHCGPTFLGKKIAVDDLPEPDHSDKYAIAKLHAERELQKIADETGIEMVIIRLPLVYGVGVKANFPAMIKAVKCGVPLPFAGATKNKRSLLGIGNLADLVGLCVSHPSAAGKTFLASDGEDLSTAELFKKVGEVLGKPARLFYVPPFFLKIILLTLGRKHLANALLESLQVDISHTCDALGWKPRFSVADGIGMAVDVA